MSLNNYMPRENRKIQKLYTHLVNVLIKLYKNKIMKNINPLKLMRNAKQEFLYQSSESFSREYCNMEKKIFGFKFEPMCVKQTRPNYSVGSDQDEAQIQYDRLRRLKWCNCEKCEKM